MRTRGARWGRGLARLVVGAAIAVRAITADAASATPAVRTTREGVMLGARIFLTDCAGCHGLKGDGKGLADPAMEPRPRDLTAGKYKLRSTWSRTPITNAELLATITNGIPGTAMPSFRYLSDDDRRHVVEYVASLASLPQAEVVDAVEVPPQPPVTPEELAEGRKLFSDLGCVACHGPAGRGDGAAGPYLKDEWGSKTPPRNLTSEPFKGGDGGRDIYLRLTVGMPGTAMPSYADAASPAQMWALVAYVQSLRPSANPAERPADAAAWGERLVAEKHCLACHSLQPSTKTPDGAAPARQGGAVGPPLDLEMRLLDLAWAKEFLLHPRDQGKIHPAFPYRMPDFALSGAEADAILTYLTSLVGRPYSVAPPPTPRIEPAEVARGRELFAASCASCHHLAGAAASAPLEQQGPDLAFAARRYDYDFMVRYIADPRQFDAHSVMAASPWPPRDVQAVAQYVWSAGS